MPRRRLFSAPAGLGNSGQSLTSNHSHRNDVDQFAGNDDHFFYTFAIGVTLHIPAIQSELLYSCLVDVGRDLDAIAHLAIDLHRHLNARLEEVLFIVAWPRLIGESRVTTVDLGVELLGNVWRERRK